MSTIFGLIKFFISSGYNKLTLGNNKRYWRVSDTDDINAFRGDYQIAEACTKTGTVPDWENLAEYDLNVEKQINDTSDVKFFMPAPVNDTVKAIVYRPSYLYIYEHVFQMQEGLYFTLQGNGTLHNDSLFINYVLKGKGWEVECECAGIRHTVNVSEPPENNIHGAVYPNPVKDRLVIPLSGLSGDFSEMKIMIYDANGRYTISFSLNAARNEGVNVSALGRGIYLHRLVHSGYVIRTGKFLKVN